MLGTASEWPWAGKADPCGRKRVRDGRLVMNRLREIGERHCSRPLRWVVSLFPFHR